jgi:hypothetical protein
MFESDRIVVHSASWAFESTTGANMIDQLTKMASTCTTWKNDVGFEHGLRTDFTIAKPDGAEAFFTYCDETEDTTTKYRYCAALAAQGNLLIEVGTRDISPTGARWTTSARSRATGRPTPRGGGEVTPWAHVVRPRRPIRYLRVTVFS